MKIAVLSDIHGNYAAFQTCVDHALKQNIHAFFFLGDYVAEFPYPQKTMEMIYEMQERYECYFIRGNKEDYWLDCKYHPDCVWKNGNHTVGAMKYTYDNLSEKDFAFYQSLPICRKIEFEGAAPIMLCHGSTERNNQKMLPGDGETIRIIEECDCGYILCGHTHGQMTIAHGEKVVWNPGAVGVPKNSCGKTQFMILHQKDMKWEPEFISLDYEKEQILNEMQESGLEQMAPYWTQVTRHLLQGGENTHSKVLFYAMDLDAAENGSTIWYSVSDKYWIKAITDLIVRKEITLGQSGAHVYELDEKRILKVAFREELQEESRWASYEKEALFYKCCKESFLPRVYVNIHTENVVFLVLEKLRPLKREELDETLLHQVMEVLTGVHALFVPDAFQSEKPQPVIFTPAEIEESLQGWKGVLAEHPGTLEEDMLEEIGRNINAWNALFFDENRVFTHGDFHFENILQDAESNIKIIDWQNCGEGHCSGDISFLLSRLSADGVFIDARKIIAAYTQGAEKYGRYISEQEISEQMSLANLNTSFRFWHMYLHGSEEKRVRDIYDKMLADARALMLSEHK